MDAIVLYRQTSAGLETAARTSTRSVCRFGFVQVRLLMTHPGVEPVTALAFVLIVGYPERFQCGKQIGSYVGLIPAESSSGVHRRLGHISKQGNALLRFLRVEAAQSAARFDPEWRRKFLRLAMRRERRIAKAKPSRHSSSSMCSSMSFFCRT